MPKDWKQLTTEERDKCWKWWNDCDETFQDELIDRLILIYWAERNT